MFQRPRLDADAVILNRNLDSLPCAAPHTTGTNCDMHALAGIFHRIVEERREEVRQMEAVAPHHKPLIDIERKLHTLPYGRELRRRLLQKRPQRHGLDMQPHLLLLGHRDSKDMLHHRRELRELRRHDIEITRTPRGVGSGWEVAHGIVGGHGHGDRGLQFVGYVVRQIAPHLLEALLPEHRPQQQHQDCTHQHHDRRRGHHDAPHPAPYLAHGYRHRHTQRQTLPVVEVYLRDGGMLYRRSIAAPHHHTAAVRAVYHLGTVWLQRPRLEHVGREVEPEVVEVDLQVSRRLRPEGIGTDRLVDTLVCGRLHAVAEGIHGVAVYAPRPHALHRRQQRQRRHRRKRYIAEPHPCHLPALHIACSLYGKGNHFGGKLFGR